ncbi:MAG: response regulator [Ignavibacteria bacterium]|nr:response regulator [Ignavibacteria bacterium]
MNEDVKILLVETDSYQKELFSIILEEAGFKISSAETVAEAVNFIDNVCIPDIIVSDVILPDSSGIDLIIILSEKQIYIPSILISSFRHSELRLRYFMNKEEIHAELQGTGFRAIIEKSADVETLLKEINNIIISSKLKSAVNN